MHTEYLFSMLVMRSVVSNFDFLTQYGRVKITNNSLYEEDFSCCAFKRTLHGVFDPNGSVSAWVGVARPNLNPCYDYATTLSE